MQVFGLLVLSLLAAQAVNMAILYLLPPPPPEFYRVSEVAQALKAPGAATPSGAGHPLKAQLEAGARQATNPRSAHFANRLREELAAQLNVPTERVRLTLLDNQRFPFRRQSARRQEGGAPFDRFANGPTAPGGGDNRAGPGRDSHRAFNERFIVSPFVASLQMADGRWSNLVEQDNGLFSTWQRRVLLWFGLCVLALAPVAWLFAKSLAAPIVALARGAERLGRDPGAPRLAIAGPNEVHTAVGAFNDMQERLRRYVTDRTGTVGAIAHDLRTPLTRLRFRLESVPEPVRGKMSADMDEMEQMIAATLAFVRDGAREAAYSRLELGSLVSTVADDMADTGLDVAATPAGGPIIVDGDIIALRRLTANLLDNAVKFGGGARVRVYAEDDTAVIEVDDDGPGVPETEMETVFEPFRRGEPSRSRETGGAGLGLAVVRSIARAHGGEASLENRSAGGLRARARLPLAPASA